MAYRRCARLWTPYQDIVAHNGTAVEPILNQSLLRNRVTDVGSEGGGTSMQDSSHYVELIVR